MKKMVSVLAGWMAAVLLMTLAGGMPRAAAEDAPQNESEWIIRCRENLEALTDFRPEVVIVLGTGWGSYVDSLDVKQVISYWEIDGWPKSTVENHAGNLIFAEYKGIRLAVMQGRVHYYEGYSVQEVVRPLRVLRQMGADTVILTNAVGAMNPEYRVGDFVCVRDQITSFVPSPLNGPNLDELGDRFVGMTGAFDRGLQNIVLQAGMDNGIPVHSGVFLQVPGPQYETPAEIVMYRNLGADTVAMSLGVEVIAARHMNMRVCAINCVSNMAAGMDEEFDHSTISTAMEGGAENARILLNSVLDALAAEAGEPAA